MTYSSQQKKNIRWEIQESCNKAWKKVRIASQWPKFADSLTSFFSYCLQGYTKLSVTTWVLKTLIMNKASQTGPEDYCLFSAKPALKEFEKFLKSFLPLNMQIAYDNIGLMLWIKKKILCKYLDKWVKLYWLAISLVVRITRNVSVKSTHFNSQDISWFVSKKIYA